MKILFLGCGDIAQQTALQLADQHQCTGLRRNPKNLTADLTAVAADITDPKQMESVLSQKFDILVVTLTPEEFTEQAYRAAYIAAAESIEIAVAAVKKSPKLVIWVSSTSVYGDQQGAWVDESSPPQPTSFSGRILLQAEQIIKRLPCATTIVRFSGIYGPGRTRMLNQVRAGKGRPAEPKQWRNRIHSEDCAGVLAHLIDLLARGQTVQPIYLASDSEPVTQHQLRSWLATQMAVKLVEEAAEPSPVRRCSNRQLLESGYRFKYPTYREGYLSLIRFDRQA